MSLGLNHTSYGPDIKLEYANPLALRNPKSFGSNEGLVNGFTGPINSQQAANSSAPGLIPKIVSRTKNKIGGTQTKLVHGSSAYGISLKPGSYEQQLPYSSMYAPIVSRGVDNIQRSSGIGAGRILLPGNLHNYEKPKLRGGDNRMTLPIPTGSKYFTTKIENGADYSIYSGSGYPPIKRNLSHGNCSRKVLIGGKRYKSKKYKKDKKNYNKIQAANHYGGCGQKKTVTLKQASKPTANTNFFRYDNQQVAGKRKQNKSKKYKKTRKQKSKKTRRKKRLRKNLNGGLSGNPLWKNEYQLSYPPNEINPWPPIKNIRPF